MLSRVKGIEIRIHGRGGQGTVTLAALIVDAAFRTGWHPLGFPSFGTERMGAPVAAFVRLARETVLDRSEISHPGLVLIQDPMLIGAVDVFAGMPPDGLIILNAHRIPPPIRSASVVAFPATDLAMRYLGVAKTSTAMLGFAAAVTGLLAIDAVCDAISDRFKGDVARRNVALARAAYAVGGGKAEA